MGYIIQIAWRTCFISYACLLFVKHTLYTLYIFRNSCADKSYYNYYVGLDKKI